VDHSDFASLTLHAVVRFRTTACYKAITLISYFDNAAAACRRAGAAERVISHVLGIRIVKGQRTSRHPRMI